MAFYMIEIQVEIPRLLQFLRSRGLFSSTADDDLGYGVHVWLRAAFGDEAPKPWRLWADGRRPARILAYSKHDAATLRRQFAEFAEPTVFAVCTDPERLMASRQMPLWTSRRPLAFEVQGCPVGRMSTSGVEKDLFLIQGDPSSPSSLDRTQVYCDWLQERMEQNQAATITTLALDGYRLVRQTRQGAKAGGSRSSHTLIRPQALFKGSLEIGNVDAFHRLIAHGVGRHRAFGYGMILLRPPS